MQEFQLRDCIHELGYEITHWEDSFIIAKKRDDDNVSDCVVGFDMKKETVSGWLITLIPIHTINDISHQYLIFRELQKDIKKFEEMTGYEKENSVHL